MAKEGLNLSNAVFRCSEGKPNIFLIGDSIRLGYCETVKNELSDKAEVFYFSDNCKSTQYVIFNMRRWAEMFDDPDKVDLIHFNCGHWDVAHWNRYDLPLTGENEYAKNIEMIIALLKDFFPNAKLVFATTTPMNPDGGDTGGYDTRTSEAIAQYNKIAAGVVKEHGISVNDLNSFVKDWDSTHYKDICHFTDSAYVTIGKEVARKLHEIL